jgi:hypothetical protein
MAPLQKRALYSFVIGLIITIAVTVFLVMRGGITAFDTDLNLRLALYAAVVGVPLVYLILVSITLRKPAQFDERDRLILERSTRAQWLAVIFSLVAWTISLSEIYRGTGQIPVVFLNLIFFSTLIISILAQSLGIMLGYWRLG